MAATLVSSSPPATIVVSAVDQQSGMAGSTLAPLTVLVTDGSGAPLRGAVVTFSVAAGGGRVSPTNVKTDATGHASTTFTLGALPGTNTVVASVYGSPATATFTETGTISPAQNRDLYVATTPGASDSNDGASLAYVSGTHGPWRTIGHAALVALPGDIVHVSTGTYPENVSIGTSGTSSAPIRFESVAIGVSPVVSSFSLSGRQHLSFRGFTVVGPKILPSNWHDMPAAVIDSGAVVINQNVSWGSGRAQAVWTKYATYMHTWYYVFYGSNYSAYTEGFLIRGSSYITIAQNTISLHTVGVDADDGSSHLVIDGNDAFHCNIGIWNGGSGSPPFYSSVISRNHCHQNLVYGLEVRAGASSITVQDNLCEYNALCQIMLNSGAYNCLVQNNTARYGGYYAETMEYPGPSAFDLYGVGSGNVVDGNLAEFQLDSTQFDGNGFIADTSGYPITFTNNVAYKNSGRGIALTKTSYNKVFNNTLVGNGYGLSSGRGSALGIGGSSSNTIENNIFASSHNDHVSITNGSTLSAQHMDYNLYGPGADVDVGGVYYSTISALRAAGQEAHGIAADPDFVNPTAPDFRPATGSPAIGAANGSVAPPVDLFGFARGTPGDIGALDH